MKPIYLVVGTPGSGKTWVCERLSKDFDYLPHDEFPNDKAYVSAIKRLIEIATKPVLIETPFSVSQILEPLSAFNIVPVFIIESEDITKSRYFIREGREIPKGHLTRIKTYIDRANELNAFQGTSQQVLAYLKEKK